MRYICKNIALMALIAFTTGCTEDTLPDSQEELVPLVISASQEATTRADATFVDGSFTAGKQVGVFGYIYPYYTSTWQETLLPNFFDNQPMTLEYNGSIWNLTYSPIKYWPSADKKMALYAYYPYDGDASHIEPDVTYGTGTFTYTTPTTASGQTDFMVTPLLTDLTSSGGTPNLEFYHTLACIEINVNLGSSYKQVKKVTVTNIYTKGRFVPQVMNEGLAANTDAWRSNDDITGAWPEYYLGVRDDMTVVDTDELSVSTPLDAEVDNEYKLLVIPQQCMSGLNQIILTLVDNSDNEETIFYNLTDQWKAGGIYSYTFNPTP